MNLTQKTNAKIQHFKGLILLSCLFFFTVATLNAQVNLRLSNDNALDIAHMDLTVENFDEIVGMQFAINYDPAQLTFIGTDNFHPDFVSFGLPEVNLVSTFPGEIRVLWIDSSPPLSGKTLADGEILFSISFTVNAIETAEVTLGDATSGLFFPLEVSQGSGPISAEGFSGFNIPDGALIAGHVFDDINENCTNDGESTYAGWSVKISGTNGTYYRITDETGYYSSTVDLGTYEIEVTPPFPYWESCEASYTVEASELLETYTQEIPAITAIECPHMEVDLSILFLRRCFDDNSAQIQYCNKGSVAATDAYIDLDLDEALSIAISTHPYTIVNGVYRFDLGEVANGACGSIGLKLEVGCEGVVLGQTHCSEAQIYPNNNCLTASAAWSGASLEVQGECTDDQVNFTITNVGNGNMEAMSSYIIIEDAVMGEPVQFQLNSGEVYPTISLPANGTTYRILVDQVVHHPGQSKPTLAVEGCGEDGGGLFSTGFVNQFAEDDENAFVDIECLQNLGAYDPNDKQGFPRGYGEAHNIEPNSSLEYLIRFQNTGTDTAFNVVVLDTISEHLDLTSLRLGAASHAYEFEIIGNNILKFNFENILLPDSFVNEPASNGFLKYTIGQLTDNEPGTRIENSAAIYFDFNEPIITNTVFHTIAEEIFTVGIYPHARLQEVEAYPNPLREAITFDLKTDNLSMLQFDLFDLLGNRLRSEVHPISPFQVRRGQLLPGVYFYNISQSGQLLASGKMIVQ